MTATRNQSIADEIDLSNLNTLPAALARAKLGSILQLLKVTFVALTGAATYDITSAALKAAATINVGALGVEETLLPAIGTVKSLRVTAATTANSVGSYAITDEAGTVLSPTASANVGLARLSDDGTTLTFATADVTAFVIEYYPAPATDLADAFIDAQQG